MRNMLTLSNTISLLRAPLAFLFLFHSVSIRIFAIAAAMLSDYIDGYLARKFKSETFLGKVLDPLMDKFFVYFVIGILFYQKNLTTFGLCALLARDLSVLLYVITTLPFYKWKGLILRPANASKITTGLQFITLMGLALGYAPPPFFYYSFLVLGVIIYLELVIRTMTQNKRNLAPSM